MPRRAAPWAGAFLAIFVAGRLFGVAGVPSSYLFGALLVGLVIALVRPGRLEVPPAGFRAAQAFTGVALGAYLQSDALAAAADAWVAVALVSLATLVLSLLCGVALARFTSLDAPTAALGMVAGGASGIVGMAAELRADDRLVAFMQYLRVLIVTSLTSVMIPIAFGVHAAARVGGEAAGPLGAPAGWALTLGAGTLGALLGPSLRLPAPALLGPLLLTAGLSVAGLLPGGAAVPAVLRDGAFALIGLRIGLTFEPRTLRRISRLALPVGLAMAGLLAACFVLGWVLELSTGVSLLDGYLATTPGGLYAVLPIAYGSGADTTFVLAVQGLRLLVMMVAAPLVVRRLLAG